MTVNELPAMKTTVHTFSLSELPKEAQRPCANNPGTRSEWLKYWNDTTTFCSGSRWFGGIKNWKEAAAILEHGWPEGAARIRDLSAQVHAPEAKSIRRKIVWGDQGDEVDKDRLNGGQLETCWRGTWRQTSIGPTMVTVNVNWGGLCNATAEQLFWQGAAACALVDALEECGYRVRVIANNWSSFDEGRLLLRWVVKDFQEPMQLDAMAAVLAHAGIYRTFGFMAKEQSRLRVDGGHGSSRGITRELMEALNDGSEQSLILDKAYSREAAILALQKVVSSLNGEQGNQ